MEGRRKMGIRLRLTQEQTFHIDGKRPFSLPKWEPSSRGSSTSLATFTVRRILLNQCQQGAFDKCTRIYYLKDLVPNHPYGTLQADTQFDDGKSTIFRQLDIPVSGFSKTKQVTLCGVWPMENWLGSSMNQILGWLIV